MNLFRVDASIREGGSHSRQIADIVEKEWRAAHPDDQVINREIGIAPLPSDAWASAAFATFAAPEDRSPEQAEAAALAATLAGELLAADALLFAVPLYNFGVSQHFKTWVDLVLTDPRMRSEGEPILAGKPAVLATVRGGFYGAGTPRDGWDHATSWYRRILADVWKLDLRVVELEFTLVGVNPALDEFKEMAANLRAAAEELAQGHGRSLSSQLVAAGD